MLIGEFKRREREAAFLWEFLVSCVTPPKPRPASAAASACLKFYEEGRGAV